jgi:hypothetical protein
MTAKAQDPVQVDPEHYKVLFENNYVRVLQYDDTPGHFVPKHSHPKYVVYALAPAVRQFFVGNCAIISVKPVTINPYIPIVKSPVTHCERNAGNTDDHLIIIEFKETAQIRKRTHAPKRRPGKRLDRKRA